MPTQENEDFVLEICTQRSGDDEEDCLAYNASLISPKKSTVFFNEFENMDSHTSDSGNKSTSPTTPTFLYDSRQDYLNKRKQLPIEGDTGAASWPIYEAFLEHSGDPVRSGAGYIYIPYETNVKYPPKPSANGWSDEKGFLLPSKITFMKYHDLPQGSLGFAKDEMITFKYSNDLEASKLKTIITGLLDDTSNTKHIDLTFEYQKPYTFDEIKDLSYINKPLYFNTDTNYNYHLPHYEDFLAEHPYGTMDMPSANSFRAPSDELWEPILPDLWSWALDQKVGDKASPFGTGLEFFTIFQTHLNLGGNIKNAFQNIINDKGDFNKTIHKPGAVRTTKEQYRNNYLDIWTEMMKGLYLSQYESPMRYDERGVQRFKLIWKLWKNKIFPASSINILNEFNANKYLFPMFHEIEFSTDMKTSVVDLFAEMQLDYAILKTIKQGENGQLMHFPSQMKKGNIEFDMVRSAPSIAPRAFMTTDAKGGTAASPTTGLGGIIPEYEGGSVQGDDGVVIERVNNFTLFSNAVSNSGPKNWLGRFTSNFDMYAQENDSAKLKAYFNSSDPVTGAPVKPSNTDHAIMAAPDSMEINLTDFTNVENKLFKTVFKTILGKRFSQIIKNKTRSFSSIADGQPAYSETFCYKIEKYDTSHYENNKDDKPKLDPIQTIYLQNSNDIDVIKYVDTQIVYDKRYTYKVYAWQVVFGTDYSYELQPVASSVPPPPSNPDLNFEEPQGGSDAGVGFEIPNSWLTEQTFYTETDYEKILGKVYRAASELLCADLAQRGYLESRIRKTKKLSSMLGMDVPWYVNPESSNDYLLQGSYPAGYSPFHLLASDDFVRDGGPPGYVTTATDGFCCGSPRRYTGHPFGAYCPDSPHKEHEHPDMVTNIPQGSSHCCSYYGYNENVNTYTKFVSRLENQHDMNILEDIEENQEGIGANFIDIHLKVSTQFKTGVLVGDSDYTSWINIMSQTLSSIIARRVRYMKVNGLKISYESLRGTKVTEGKKINGAIDNQNELFSWGTASESKDEQAKIVMAVLGETQNYLASTYYINEADNSKKMLYAPDFRDKIAFTSTARAPEGKGDWSWKGFKIPFWDAVKFLRSIDFLKLKWFEENGDNDSASEIPVLAPEGIPGISPPQDFYLEELDNTFQMKLGQYVDAIMELVDFKHSNAQDLNITVFPPMTPETPEMIITAAPEEYWQYIDTVKKETNIKVTTRPKVKLIEVPYFETNSLVVKDFPPLYPNVDIIPYKNVNNQILINLSSNTGEINEPANRVITWRQMDTAEDFLSISEEENYWVSIYMQQYDVPESTAKEYLHSGVKDITFKTDDTIKEFQIFRIAEEDIPDRQLKNMFDFLNSSILDIPSEGYSSTSFVDDIEPNKVYYYMFRAKDAHSHVSNPSPIYKVQLVDMEGAVYLLSEIVEFGRDFYKIGTTADLSPAAYNDSTALLDYLRRQAEYSNKGKNVKSLRKYIHISPAFRHTMFDEERTFYNEDGLPPEDIDTTTIEKPILGLSEPRLFGATNKRYKIRLTSKSTGKKFDINVKFKHDHEIPEMEKQISSEPIPKYSDPPSYDNDN